VKIGLVKDIGVGGVVRAWTQATAFLVVVVAGRVLDSQEFGIFAIAAVFITVLSTIMYSGIYEYIIQIDDFGAVADTCFWINFGIATIGTAMMTLAAPIVAAAVHAPQLEGVMLWLAPIAMIAALTSWQEALVLRRRKVSGYYVIWFFVETGSAAFAIGLFFHGFKIGALVGYRYSQAILTSFCYTIYIMKIPRLVFRIRQARRALAFASRLYGSRLIGIFSNYSADLIIGILAGPAEAGVYRLASRTVFGVSEIWFQPIKMIAWVRFSSATRNRAGLDQEWLVLMMVLSMVAWPALGGVAVLSRQLTETVFGAAWSAAAPIVTILAFAKSAELFEVFLDPLLTISGQLNRLLLTRAAASIVAVVGFVALARLGAAHAALAQAGTYLLLAIVTVKVGTKLTNVSLQTLAMTLWPGIATTMVTVTTAAATANLIARSGLGSAAQLACDVGAGAVVWALMVAVVFRRRTLATVWKLKDPNSWLGVA
jgi:O-antigen/teichoic acid export membrane protein